jgi:hypothetical protein
MVHNENSAHVVRSVFHSGRFLHEAEVKTNQKQAEMDEATNPQKGRGHRSESKERKRQRNSDMKPRQIPACSSCDKKRAGQKLKNVLPDAFHSVMTERATSPQLGLFIVGIPSNVSLVPQAISLRRG